MAKDLVIGIDIGGQTSKCGIVDARGTVLAQTVIRSDNHTTVEPFIADKVNYMASYWVLAVCVAFILSFAVVGSKIKKT